MSEERVRGGVAARGGCKLNDEELALLSHYLHNGEVGGAYGRDAGKVSALAAYLSQGQTEETVGCGDGEEGGLRPVAEQGLQYGLFREFFNVPFPAPKSPRFTFIDLFAGIGGFRIALQSLGGKCVYSSELDADARKTYFANYGDMPFGDITLASTKSHIPESFDILCGGFPCQAFSIAGYRKGFGDARGTLFFDVAEILKVRKPKAVLLENVKNLQAHDGGRTFAVIKSTLEGLGYVVYHKVMNAMEYADVPQNRERVFIVGFDPERVPAHSCFSFPEPQALTKKISDCIDYSVQDERLFYTERFPHYDVLVSSVTSRDTVYQWRRQYVRENKSGVCPTLTANMGTGGHNVPLILTDNGIRKLTPKECVGFQGFPKEFVFPGSVSQAAQYKQAGNSVVVPLVAKVCERMIMAICSRS